MYFPQEVPFKSIQSTQNKPNIFSHLTNNTFLPLENIQDNLEFVFQPKNAVLGNSKRNSNLDNPDSNHISKSNLNLTTSISALNSSGYRSFSSQQLINTSSSLEDMFKDRQGDNASSQMYPSLGGQYPPSHFNPSVYRDKTRPSSARETFYPEFSDPSSIPGYSSSRLRGTSQPYAIEQRGTSLDRNREPSYPNYSKTSTKRSTRTGSSGYSGAQSSYGNPDSLGHNPTETRRSHSYEQNLERQTLTDTSLLPQDLNTLGIFDNIDPLSSLQPLIQNVQNPLNFQLSDTLNLNPSSLLQNMDTVRECARLSQELEISREKLNACLTSIRTFWSPELKRERGLRKEENAKYAILVDHMHQIQLDKQTMLQSMHNIEAELHRLKATQRDSATFESLQSKMEVTKKRVNELTRENRLLIKEMEEAERRTNSLKSSLAATEQSLRNLVDAVKSGKTDGSASIPRLDRIESDIAEIERLRNQLSEASQRAAAIERSLIDRDCEFSKLKEDDGVLHQELLMIKQENETLRHEKRQIQTLQALVDTKVSHEFKISHKMESKILTLENEIHLLEEEISRLRDEGIVTPTTSISSGIEDVDKTLQQFRSNERMLKSKIELLNGEISKRDSEIFALQSRLEMLEKQHQDQNHHIDVLKEQVKTREHKITTITADLDELRKRMKDKDSSLEKKTKSISSMQTIKRQLELQMSELKEQVDIRDRKISLLQRKVENLEETLNDKESHLTNLRNRIGTQVSATQVQIPHLKSTYEDAVRDHERQIERLRESKERAEFELHEEMEIQKRLNQELRVRLDSNQRELEEKANQLLETREELSQLRSVKFEREAENSHLQGQISQKQSEIAALQVEKKLIQKQIFNESEIKFQQRVSDLESQVNHYMESASKLQSEVDRLLGLIRNLDAEKMDKENLIQDLEEQLQEAQNSVNSIKRTNQMERQKMSQMLNESRQRTETLERDVELSKSQTNDKESRIRELEQALRESVRLTAERDMFATGREETTRLLDQQMRDLRSQVEQLQRERNNLSGQLQMVQDEVKDKEAQFKVLESECFQSYLPELEKLRKSNYELNLRIAALLKLIQGREYQLTEEDKLALSSISMYATLGPTQTVNVGGYLGFGRGTPIGGTTSPHLVGSAFQLIGTGPAQIAMQKAYSTGMRSPLIGGPPVTTSLAQRLALYTSGTQPVMSSSLTNNPGICVSTSGTDANLLSRILAEKENTLQQNLLEITKLRISNAELDVQLKSLQTELDNKNQRLRTLGGESSVAQAYRSSTTSGEHQELARLRQQTQDLIIKLDQTKRCLSEREDRLRLIEATQSTDLAMELDKQRKEIDHLRLENAGNCSIHEKEIERLRNQNLDLNNNCVQLESIIREKEANQTSSNQEKMHIESEYDSLQKKYKSVLTQLTEKSDKIQQLENECYHGQISEIKRLRLENEEYERRITHIQRNLVDRESRCDQLEKEINKSRDDSSCLRRQLHASDVELKSLKEESVYREERIRQMQNQHNEEMNRLRTTSQEQASKASHWKLALEDKEHEVTLIQNEFEKCKLELIGTKKQTREQETELVQKIADLEQISEKFKGIEHIHEQELEKLKMSLDEAQAKANIAQKRIEERESRLRKIEQENNSFLDEIHSLRKKNQETESQIDCLRQRLIDDVYEVRNDGSDADKLRAKNSQLLSENTNLQRSLSEAQIQLDRIALDRDNLKTEITAFKERVQHLNESLIDARRSLSDFHIANKSKRMIDISVQSHPDRNIEDTTVALELSLQQSQQDRVVITELRGALEQALVERDQLREQTGSLLAVTDLTQLETHQQYYSNQSSLQQQVILMQQAQRDTIAEMDRLRRDAQKASVRVQDLTRQLHETQSNCDSIAKQRDLIQEQLSQYQRTYDALGITLGGGTSGLMQKALLGPTGSSVSASVAQQASGSHLSRELDRLHREHEQTMLKLEETEVQARTYRAECEGAKSELRKSRDELSRLRERLKELQEQSEAREDEMSKLQRLEAEKCRGQVQEASNQLAQAHHQLQSKEAQLDRLMGDLELSQKRISELELSLRDLSKLEQQQITRNELDENERQRHRYETETLRKEIELRENQLKQAQLELERSITEANELRHMLEELSNQLELAKGDLESTKKEARDAINQASKWAKDQEFKYEEKMKELQGPSPMKITEFNVQMEQMKQELNDANKACRDAENVLDKTNKEIETLKQDLEERNERIQILEVECFQQQAEELERLRKELRQVTGGIGTGQPQISIQQLKQEIDILHREISRRDETISNMNRECQENHIRKLEAVQQQLRRYEEEAANLSKVLDEQRRSLEERDRQIKRMQAEGGGSGMMSNNVEYERLIAEHAQCNQQLEARAKQITTLANQLENQTAEILSIKQEALTASLCEKDANIALMEITAPPNNPGTANVIEKMREERAQIQQQLKQLSTARAAMEEEKKSRGQMR